MMRVIPVAAALLAPATAFAHGGHPPAGPHAHGLWHLFLDPGLVGWLAILAAGLLARYWVRRVRRSLPAPRRGAPPQPPRARKGWAG
jgi:hypothetical protein